MLKSNTAKFIASLIGLTMVLSFVAVPTVKAQTVDELNAQIQGLLATIAQLQSTLSTLQGGAATPAATNFTQNLTVGSTGAQVTALQAKLGISPATGYFGAKTKAAVVSFQKENGLPATGYVGPMTRGVLNASVVTVPTTPTTPTTPVTPVVTTNGVEGSLSVTLNPTPASGITVREGDSKIPVVGIKMDAKLSDIKVERVKIDLGTSSSIYNKQLTNIYLLDGSTVVSQSALNSSTVVKEGTKYYITLTGFGVVVPKDSSKVLTVAIDVNGSVGSSYVDSNGIITIDIPANGVRGIDGAGLNQYGPSSAFGESNNITVASSLSTSATLSVAADASTPASGMIIANDGSNNNQKDGVTLLNFTARAEKDNVLIHSIPVRVVVSGSGATVPTIYLYDGSTLLSSASLSSSGAAGTYTATFGSSTNIEYTIPANTTKVLTIKGDIRNANGTDVSATASLSSTDVDNISSENSQGDTLADSATSGSATGNALHFVYKGPQFTLVSKSVTKSSTASQSNSSTSTVEGDFQLQITAVGGNVTFSNVLGAPSTNAYGTAAGKQGFLFGIYQGGSLTTLGVASTTSFGSVPSALVTSGVSGEYVLPQNQTVTLPLTYLFEGRKAADGSLVSTNSYAVGLEGFAWGIDGAATTSSTFTSGLSDWRTNTVQLP